MRWRRGRIEAFGLPAGKSQCRQTRKSAGRDVNRDCPPRCREAIAATAMDDRLPATGDGGPTEPRDWPCNDAVLYRRISPNR
ncbi:hypothetical protein ACHAWF_015683 [Thalassiosira exigua]